MKSNTLPILLATTFLSTSAVAQTVPTIDAKYLNQYTSPDITWKETSVSSEGAIAIQTGEITKYFQYVYTTPEGREVYDKGGVSRWGDAEYEDIHADFIGVATGIYNFVSEDYAYNISGNFINNGYSSYDSKGAIYNDYHGTVIQNIDGNFVGNKTAITNEADDHYVSSTYFTGISSIDSIEGIFIGNETAIYNRGNAFIKEISGIFIANNKAIDNSYSGATGGAIENTNCGYNTSSGTINTIKGDFISNSAVNSQGNAFGGAIYNIGTIGEIINSNFIDNYVLGTSAYGGAIYSTSSLNIIADNGTSLFKGNMANNKSNAIYLQGQAPINPTLLSTNAVTSNGYIDLNLSVKNKGTITFDDVIDGEYYNINVNGDIDKEDFINRVTFNNKVNSVYDLTLTATQMALGKNAVINIVHNYVAQNNPYLRLDLDAVNREVGQLNIGGNVVGTTNVIVNILQHKDIAEKNSIVFATAKNHSLSKEDAKKSFEVYRVVGSPYKWAVSYNTSKKTWGLFYVCTENCPEPETPEVFDGFMPTLDRIKEGTQIVDYISDVEALPNSAFAYEETTSWDNSFSFTDTNAYGAETDKTYKIVLKPEEFSTSSDLTFTADDNGSIEVQLPNDENQYFSYEWTGSDNYEGDGNDAAINWGQNGSGEVAGGVIYNWSEGDLTVDFVENYVSSSDGFVYGGAIFNDDNTIGDITGDFVGNYAEGKYMALGGAIFNGLYNLETSVIGDITGSFIGNHSISTVDGISAGAIANIGTIGNITGDFIGNYAESNNGPAYGGAIMNGLEIPAELGNITGDFIANHVKGIFALGGAISNIYADIEDITGDFIGNYAEGEMNVFGGAILHAKNPQNNIGSIGTINGSFINNYVKHTGTDGIGLGGAIYVQDDDLAFKADGITNRFSGNYVENADGSKVNNAIFVNNNTIDSPLNLNFEVTNGGGYVFDDEIDGGFVNYTNDGPTIIRDGYGYNVNIYGDVCPQCIVNSVIFNSKVKNVYDLTLDTTQMVLGKNAHIEIVNDYIAQNNPYLRLNVDAVNGQTGQLEIGGQVIGTTQVIANIVNYKDVRGEESIVFATAVNDITGGGESFKIFRTVGSPYKWYVDYDESAKTWGLAMGEEANDYEEDCYPDPNPKPEPEPNPVQPLGPIQVEPEIIGFEALQSAGLSQTNGMVYNIMRKVGVNRLYCPGCGFYDYNWDGEAFHNVWVDTTYNGLTIEAPVEIDAKVWGIEAGADIQKDLNNKLGIFVSYRQGNYEMDGKGEKYYSKVGSELDIDSYLAGLYYRYDNNNWYAFATLYGGMQNAEIQTDDGVSADTDGLEFGGSAEVGYSYALNKTVYVTPSLGVFYSQINYDDASDDYGKTVEYGDLKQVELEAGLKLSKAVYTDNGTASVYVKPSVVQTLVDGDEINITEIGKVDTIEDKTLGRIEIGGSYGFNDNWSAYGWANYTFGSDYEATSLGAGINYAW